MNEMIKNTNIFDKVNATMKENPSHSSGFSLCNTKIP